MGRWRKPHRVNAKGRNEYTTRFARLDHRILNSNAYRALSPNARSLLVELAMIHNGENNGSLYLSVRDAAHRMGVADLSAASRAFDDLMALGFIEMTQEAHFRVKAAEASRARCWRLAWEAGPGRKAPAWDFLTREPGPHTTARKRMERGLKALKAYRRARDGGRLPVWDSDTFSPSRPVKPAVAVSDFATPIAANGGFPPKPSVRESAAHIAAPWGVGATCNPLGWWQPDWTPKIAALAFASTLAQYQWSEAA